MSIRNFWIIEALDGFDTDQQVDVGENDIRVEERFNT